MARVHYRDPGTGNWVPVGTVGPAGPSEVSADAGNMAVIGTDDLIYVPTPTPPVLDHGGLTGLADDDHTHYFNQTRGDARYALTGHSHGATILPADVAPPAIAAASAVGVSVDYAREDHTHQGVQLASGAPPALTPDIAGAVGAGTTAARDNHVHNVPAAAPITNLTATTTNAEGTGSSFARNDHTHAIDTAAPVALGAANAVGTATSLARSDHVHIYPTAANVGAATSGDITTAISSHTSGSPHVALSAITPTAMTPDLAGAAGAGSSAARTDHAHGIAAAAPTTNLTAATTNAEGTGSSFARNDHTHAITANVAGAALAAAGAVGTSAALARGDHVHPFPSATDIGAASSGDITTAITNHEGAADPHTGYQKESEKAAASGYASLDASTKVPIAQVPTGTSGTTVSLGNHAHAGVYEPSGTVATHAAAADPHTGYQKESEKGAANGYASLDAGGLVPTAQLPSMGVTDHGALTGILDDDHPHYQLRTEKGAVNGYAGLDASGLVPLTQLPPISSAAEVTVEETEPVAVELVMWVDPNDFQGESGWQGFDARYVNTDGDAMTGPLAMGNQKITGLGAPTVSTDAMTLGAADTKYLAKTGGTMSGPIAMGTQKVTGLAAPTVAGDATDKTYVDNAIAAKIATATISSTAPASPVVGQLWAQP